MREMGSQSFGRFDPSTRGNATVFQKLEGDFRLPFPLRMRSIAFEAVLSMLLVSGPPWWWSWLLQIELTKTESIALTFAVAVPFSFAIALSAAIRAVVLKQEQRTNCFGELASFYREIIQDPENMGASVKNPYAFKTFCDSLCDHIAQAFQRAFDDPEIACCIRLSRPEVLYSYRTVGRSARLSSDRARHSADVTAESGIYKALTYKNAVKDEVLIIHDIDKAIEEEIFTSDYNTRHYPGEIASMMVSRLNVPVVEHGVSQEALWGILYIVHSKRHVFGFKHAIFMKQVSNSTAGVLYRVICDRERRMATKGGHNASGKAASARKKNNSRDKNIRPKTRRRGEGKDA